MIRIIEEKVERKKLYKYTTVKLKVPKNMELDTVWGHTDEIPNVSSNNGVVEIVFKQLLKSSDRGKIRPSSIKVKGGK
jgi:hypothetical protein